MTKTRHGSSSNPGLRSSRGRCSRGVLGTCRVLGRPSDLDSEPSSGGANVSESEAEVRRDLLDLAAITMRQPFAVAYRDLIERHGATLVFRTARELETESMIEWPSRADPNTLHATVAGLAERQRLRNARPE